MSVLPMGPRVGPWLPNVRTAPASYAGPLVYGSGLVFAAQDAWEAFYALRYDGAPRDITAAEALAIARAEHELRGPVYGQYHYVSRCGDGGMHIRETFSRSQIAVSVVNARRAALREKIMEGRAVHTIFYDRARDTFYCG